MRYLFILLLAGCSAVPACPQADAMILQTQDGSMLVAFTSEALQIFHDTILAEAKGECRVVKKGEV